MKRKLLGSFIFIVSVFVIVLIVWSSMSLLPSSHLSEKNTVTNFTFDNGEPKLSAGLGTPFHQTVNGVTAAFSSPSDPTAFSIQNYGTTFTPLSMFSGNYLWDDQSFRADLDIKFSRSLTAITLTFVTVEHYAAGERDQPSTIELFAYENVSTMTMVGSSSAHGNLSGATYAQGLLSFESGNKPFNQVRLTLPVQTMGASQFYIDNVTITLAS